MNKTRFIHFPLLLAVLALAVGLVWYTQPTEAESIPSDKLLSSNLIYLPIIANIEPFTPPGDITLPGGTYTFATLDIPDGVTVTVTGDVHITVTGDTNIAGTLAGDCAEVQLHGQQDVTVTGTIDNLCNDEDAVGADLIIYSHGGNMKIGTFEEVATLRTSGNIDVGNAPDLESWEIDVLPEQAAADPLAPVCSAQTDLLGETVMSDFPVEVFFWGEGIDPNRGPVSYAWDFGDGHTATEQDASHTYTSWGVYQVTLTVTDESGATCEATLQIVLEDDDTNSPEVPAVQIVPLDMVVPVGETAVFASEDFHFDDDELTYTWDYGDGTMDNEPDGEHLYTTPGRYEVSLTVVDLDGDAAEATAAVYVYEPETSLVQRTPQSSGPLGGGDCTNTAPDNVFDAAVDWGVANRHGSQLSLRWADNDFYIGGGANIKGQDGGPGRDRSGSGSVRGGNGGHGGSVQIWIRGNLTVCSGASIESGSGGRGGNAFSYTPAPGSAVARGGRGGQAAPRLTIGATRLVVFEPTVYTNPGNGGPGGIAEAVGGDGDNACPTGHPGATANARGGPGGEASKRVVITRNMIGAENILGDGGLGGDGGGGIATGGSGGNALCQTIGHGGDGRQAVARGGPGGHATLSGQWRSITLTADAFTAGTGGTGDALGGDGGYADVTPPGGTLATGGDAGFARSIGGRGGRGHHNGDAGDSFADGGQGGLAWAIGEDGAACEDGLEATAVGGDGGDASARKGRIGGPGANEGITEAVGGTGGKGEATGGNGGDCDVCPGGDGGAGGEATATGGKGGDALGNGDRTGGDGGMGDALGGQGGDGADCCGPPHLAGGDGGEGGAATSVAGAGGSPNGAVGDNATRGGNGGDGGEGEGPGSGGAGGPGTGIPVDIPDGLPGANGEECPVEPPPDDPRQGTPNHDQIPDGVILPGSQYELDVIDPEDPDFMGIVPTLFMDEDDLLPYDIPFAHYEKMPDHIFVGSGGIQYDLNLLPDNFSVLRVEFTVIADCPPGCVMLMGFYQGELIATVENEGLPGPEMLELPDLADTGSTAPHYDTVIIIAFGPMAFDLLGLALWDG